MDIASKHSFDAGFHLIINRCLNYFFLGLRRAQPSSSKFGSSPLNFTLSLFWKNHIFRRDYLIQQEGQYKGAPLRTKAGGRWLNGYSDHLPVVMYLVKEKL